MKNNKIILNFIFKNEEEVLPQMLTSTLGFIDYIVAIDTGSTDNSIKIIEEFGKQNNIPCYIKSSPFQNFGLSRNEALDYAFVTLEKLNMVKSETYLYWMDCDEILTISKKFKKEKLNKQSYTININYSNISYRRNCLIRMDNNFKWIGPIHEFIEIDVNHTFLKFMEVDVYQTGASWKLNLKTKYKNYAEISLKEFELDHNSKYASRWLFYTAQSYFDAAMVDVSNIDFKLLKEAKKFYKLRCLNGGYRDEKFWSKYRLGIISNLINDDLSETKKYLLEAYTYDTRRVEPIYYLMELYMSRGEYAEAFIYASLINNEYKTPPSNVLFGNTYIYNQIGYTYSLLKCSINK